MSTDYDIQTNKKPNKKIVISRISTQKAFIIKHNTQKKT
jgi:hypothetical protein